MSESEGGLQDGKRRLVAERRAEGGGWNHLQLRARAENPKQSVKYLRNPGQGRKNTSYEKKALRILLRP